MSASGESRTSLSDSTIGAPAAIAVSEAWPGGAPATVDTSRAWISSGSTRQVRGGVSVRSSTTIEAPTRSSLSIVSAGGLPAFFSSARRPSRSEMLYSLGPVRTTRTVSVWNVASVMCPRSLSSSRGANRTSARSSASNGPPSRSITRSPRNASRPRERLSSTASSATVRPVALPSPVTAAHRTIPGSAKIPIATSPARITSPMATPRSTRRPVMLRPSYWGNAVRARALPAQSESWGEAANETPRVFLRRRPSGRRGWTRGRR